MGNSFHCKVIDVDVVLFTLALTVAVGSVKSNIVYLKFLKKKQDRKKEKKKETKKAVNLESTIKFKLNLFEN